MSAEGAAHNQKHIAGRILLCRAFGAHSCYVSKSRPDGRAYSLSALRASPELIRLKQTLVPKAPRTSAMVIRPEGPAVHRPDRQVGIINSIKMSAEGAAHNQKHIAGRILLCRAFGAHRLPRRDSRPYGRAYSLSALRACYSKSFV
jgi:hypothetical protein